MFKRMMKHLINNPGLKILSILIAVVLWMIVVNYDDPEKTVTFTLPVSVTNAEVLEEMGKVYEVVGQTNMAVFYVKGKRSVIDNLSSSDFVATADLSQIDFQSDSDIKLVPISVDPRRSRNDIQVTLKTVNMQITLEDLSSEQFYIAVNTQGMPAEGYAIGEISVSPNLVTVSGPRSVVDRISRVAANVNVAGLTSDIVDSVRPVLYDENGGVIESTQLRLNQESVDVSVQILGTKIVAVQCETSGTPAEGYQFIELEYAPETVMIKGQPEILNNIYEIRIPGEAINLDGITEDVENSIDITPYLNELGVSLVNPEENKIAVRVIVERLEVIDLELSTDDLTVLNRPEDYDISFGSQTVTIPVRGRSGELENLTLSQVRGSVDLYDLEPGTHTVEVTVTLPDHFQVMGTVTIQVHIMYIEESSGNEDGDDAVETGGEANSE